MVESRRIFAVHGGVFWLSLPLVIMLLWAVPWEGDPRTADLTERLVKLRASQWSWDQVEFDELVNRTDVNFKVNGKPLFVKFAIEGDDEQLLKRMISRGVDVNSSDWGCTPLLAAFAADKERRSERFVEAPTFTKILLRAGADPNVFPSQESVNRSVTTGIPKKPCRGYENALKTRSSSILELALDMTTDDETFRLLLDRGAKPKGRKDALRILDQFQVRRAKPGTALFEIRELGLKELALSKELSLGEDQNRDDTPLMYSIAARPVSLSEVGNFLKAGADPNGRSGDGTLPLEAAIHHCIGRQESDRPYMTEDDWRKKDKDNQEENHEVALLIALLLKSGADPNLPARRDVDHPSRLPSLFAQAVEKCPSNVPRLLLDFGAKVDKASVEAALFDLKQFLQSRSDKPESSRGTAGSAGNPR